MVVIDLFSGAGGLTEGFMRQGFEIVAHVEKDKWACETLKTRIIYHFLKSKNDLKLYFDYFKKVNGYLNIEESRKDIYIKYPEIKAKLQYEVLNRAFGNPLEEKNVTGIDEIIKLLEESLKHKNHTSIDLIIGGPPCQAYSLVGRGRMKDKADTDKRNYLFRYYKEVVKHFEPKMFIFENVPGILNAKKGEVFNSIVEEFQEIGYTLLAGTNDDPKECIVDASDFGVHQSRKRMILFGFKSDLNYQYPNFIKHAYSFENMATENAIGDLPKLKSGQGNDFEILSYDINEDQNLSEFQKLMRADSIGVINHKSRPNKERDLRIYKKAIEFAESGTRLRYTDIPEEDRTHKNEKSFLDRFKVHIRNEIPHTIVAHISKDGHYNIHPDINQCRSLTVREAARIQSFPDNYIFEGPRTSQFTQVGNAVPPLMSEAIAKEIKEYLNKKI